VSEIAEARPSAADFPAVVINSLSELAAADRLETLTERGGFFRSLVDALPIAVYATDADGRITYFNEAAVKLWGRAPKLGEDFWCGSWHLFTTDGEPLSHDECPMAIALKTGEMVRGVEAIAERPDGTRFRFVPHPTPLFDRSGKLVGALNVLLDVTDRQEIEKASRHLAAIVESSEDAVISKTLEGVIQSWNRSAERMFGYTAQEIVGRSVLTLIPRDRHHEEDEILRRLRQGERIEHFETIRRTKDGRLIDVSLTVSPIKDVTGRIIGASKMARDISDEKRAHRQLEILYRVSKEMSRDLNLDRVVQTVTDLATDACGAKFGAFFYNVVSKSGESFQLCGLTGASKKDFGQLGMPRNTAVFAPTFHGKKIVRSGDIRKDPRYGLNGPHFGMPTGHLAVVSYMAVPVMSVNGEVHGGLILGHDQPDVFTQDAQTLVAAIASQAAVAMDNARLHRAAEAEIEQRRKAEDDKELLLNEIKHRVKNTLGTVLAMATQTFREAPAGERQAFGARIQALAEAHEGLNQRSWQSATMRDTAERSMRAFMDGREKRIAWSGPDVELRPNTALLVSMLLHELGTNAVKYGSLSNLEGSVELNWRVEGKNERTMLKLEWSEAGGPLVQQPTRKGFGSRLIERALRGENGSAEISFDPAGLRCSMTIPLAVHLAG